LAEALRVFPNAELFTVVDKMSETDRARLGIGRTRTTPLQQLPGVARYYRSLLPLMPLAMRSLDVSAFDVVLSISHAVAKGIRIRPEQVYVCLCLSPMRYAWDLREQYLKESELGAGIKGGVVRRMLDAMQRLDTSNTAGVTSFIAISQYIADRILRAYGRDSAVIYPPTEYFTPTDEPRTARYVTASRFVPYKRIDLIVRTFAAMPERELVVIGDGPDWEKVQRAAASNITLMGRQSPDVLRGELRRARAFVFAADDDFGIAPVEAQACGTPVIAFGRGGALETVKPLGASHASGIFFAEQSERAIVSAVVLFERERANFDSASCRLSAERFASSKFRSQLLAYVQTAYAGTLPGAELTT
jgi:glycosyltransferase involved in cell wall biosynthesis